MITHEQLYSRPQPYDGKRKGIVGICLALWHISQQLDYLIRKMDREVI